MYIISTKVIYINKVFQKSKKNIKYMYIYKSILRIVMSYFQLLDRSFDRKKK